MNRDAPPQGLSAPPALMATERPAMGRALLVDLLGLTPVHSNRTLEDAGGVVRTKRRLTIGDRREKQAMARYFFHSNDSQHGFDDLGLDLPDDDDARREAVRFGGGLLRDDPDIVRGDAPLRINVVDDGGRFCFAVIILAVDAAAPHPD